MKKTFYLITEKNYNNNNKLDVGTFIEKIILSTDTEDFKEFSKESFGETLKEVFDNYENIFWFNFNDMLKEQRKKTVIKNEEDEFNKVKYLLNQTPTD